VFLSSTPSFTPAAVQVTAAITEIGIGSIWADEFGVHGNVRLGGPILEFSNAFQARQVAAALISLANRMEDMR
jgi:hypothetical protein